MGAKLILQLAVVTKIFALLIAMVMVRGMSTSVFAATITINQDNTEGTAGAETYTAYKIFDVTKTSDVTGDVTTDETLGEGKKTGFAYTVDAKSAWVNVLDTAEGKKYFTLTKSADGKLYTVKLVDGNNSEAKAKEIAAWLLKNVPQTLASIDTTKKVTVHDNLADVLKFNNEVKVYVNSTDPSSTATDYKKLTYSALTNEYTVKTSELADNSCDFEIDITTTGLAGKYLVFKYSAEFTSAAVKDEGYVNEEYSTYSKYKTEPSKPEVKTYDFEFTKVDKESNKLDGAKFKLYATWNTATNAPSDPIELIADGANYKKADSDDTNTVTEISVDSAKNQGATNISGLGGTAEGTNCYLVETAAPSGFNKLTAPIIVNIKDEGTITVSLAGEELESANDAFNVVNQSGTVLPSTGGMGTTIFYVLGAILVLGAGVLLITKRRMSR